MDLLQIILVYFVSWWLVLFMVLPFRAAAPQEPGLGHAPSAPENPLLKQKFIWTSGLAAVVTALLYLLSGYVSLAHADDDMYHASSGLKKSSECKNRAYQAPADINVKDGTGSKGKQVAPATIGGSIVTPSVDVGVNGDKYVPPGIDGTTSGTSATPVNPNSFLGLGRVSVEADGTASLDGKPLTSAAAVDCNEGVKP